MSVKFQPLDAFRSAGAYQKLPIRAARIPGCDQVLVTSEAGEHLFLSEVDFDAFTNGTLPRTTDLYESLLAKQFAFEGEPATARRILAAKVRTKKMFVREGPTLHLFVVSLRCDHSCHYCQVSRQSPDRAQFDMSLETAAAAVDRMFETPSPNLTVEFQGGEPLLNFSLIRQIVQLIEQRNSLEQRRIVFTIVSTLHHLTHEILAFFHEHDFQVSTSLDGPAWLHDANRPTPTKDAHVRTVTGIELARKVLGVDKVSALTTLTRRSLEHPEAIIDEYIRLGFHSIFLRPLSPFGFAVKAERKIGYEMRDFVDFYDRALSYVLKLNRDGVALEEAYASILLTHILTPFPSRYVDLRSPTGAGFGTLVYNYDGSVYPSDEGRMLSEMGDHTFRLGSVHQAYSELMASPAMDILRRWGVAEDLPGCADCAFVPFCGADPVHMHATQGSASENPLTSAHHRRHIGLFQILFQHLAKADPEVMRVFLGWVTHNTTSAADLARAA